MFSTERCHGVYMYFSLQYMDISIENFFVCIFDVHLGGRLITHKTPWSLCSDLSAQDDISRTDCRKDQGDKDECECFRSIWTPVQPGLSLGHRFLRFHKKFVLWACNSVLLSRKVGQFLVICFLIRHCDEIVISHLTTSLAKWILQNSRMLCEAWRCMQSNTLGSGCQTAVLTDFFQNTWSGFLPFPFCGDARRSDTKINCTWKVPQSIIALHSFQLALKSFPGLGLACTSEFARACNHCSHFCETE